MIKLKNILFEGHYPVVVGIITMDGQIKSMETDRTHGDLNFKRGICWRYNPSKKTTYWHGDESEHDEADEINVDSHLQKKYGYTVNRNITLGGSESMDNMELYGKHHNDAHGVYRLNESHEDTPIQKESESLRRQLEQKYPQLEDLFFYVSWNNVLNISALRVKSEFRGTGIGTSVMGEIIKFADKHKLPIVLSPGPERGKKEKLDRFYKKLGFVTNKGRNRDYRLSSAFGKTMYRRPMNEGFELPSDTDTKSEILSRFIASFFLNYFKTKISNTKTKSDQSIVKYNMYYRLAKQYREAGKHLFKVTKDNSKTYWGKADYKLTSKDESMPNVIVKMYDGNTTDVQGYVDDTDMTNIKNIYIVVFKSKFINTFNKATEELTDTIKHEVRHWVQFKTQTGLPKEKILNRDTDVLGNYLHDISPKDMPGLKYKAGREQHHMRDIEFKTNVHTYAFYIKQYLNKNVEKNMWARRFKSIVNGVPAYTGLERMDFIIDNLGSMKKKDDTRWKQFVKELYKLIFL